MTSICFKSVQACRNRWMNVAVLIAVAVSAVAVSAPAAAGSELVSSPSRFAEDFSAGIASDGPRIYVAVTGVPRKRNVGGQLNVRTQVFVRKDQGWKALSRSLPSTNRSATDMLLLRFPGTRKLVPCVSFTTRENVGQIRCHMSGKWRSVKVARSLRRLRFVEANSIRGKLTVLFSSTNNVRASTVQIGTLRGKRITPRGPAKSFACSCFPALGQRTLNARSGLVDVAFAALDRKRFVATLSPGGWTRSELLPKLAPGVPGWQSSTIRTRQGLLIPVHTISTTEGVPWTLSIYRRQNDGSWVELGEKPLNVGSGNAQGTILPVGNRVWALWEEYGKEGTDEPTDIYGALVDQSGTGIERTIPLWSGQTDLPGAFEGVGYKSGPVFLYSRSLPGREGSFVTVDMTHLRD